MVNLYLLLKSLWVFPTIYHPTVQEIWGSNHLDDLAAIRYSFKGLRDNLSVLTASAKKSVPPTKEEVSRNQLEPGGEGVGFKKGLVNARTRQWTITDLDHRT